MKSKKVLSLLCAILFLFTTLSVYSVTATAELLSVTTPSVSFGNGFAVAVSADGQIYTWGKNTVGQLGNSTTATAKIASAISASATFCKASAGSDHVLALDTDGRVWAWGGNASGQLGNKSTENSSTPIQISFPEEVTITAIAAGASFSLALASDGSVWGWGSNQQGLLANGTHGIDDFADTPTKISFSDAGFITSIWLGNGVAAAKAVDNSLWLWGDNRNRQTGASSGDYITTPTAKNLNGQAPISVVFGTDHTAVLTADAIYSFGINANGVFGNNSVSNSASVALRDATLADTALPIKSIAAGSTHMLALGSDSKLYTWGANDSLQLGYEAEGDPAIQKTPKQLSIDLGEATVLAVAAAYSNSAILDSDGYVYTWGANESGQLGNNTQSGDGVITPASVLTGSGKLRLGKGPDRILQEVPITATATVPSPTYQITIPATLEAGTLTQCLPSEPEESRISCTELTVGISSVANLFGEKQIVVRVQPQNSAFLFTDGDHTLPYSLFATATGGSALEAGDIFATFLDNSLPGITGRIEIDRSLITRSGNYSTTLTFSVEIVAIP